MFLEQQAYRLGITMQDFARLALEFQGQPPRIAARCSVFAKTDLIHLQQKGVPVGAMLYALCDSIARMVAALKKGPFEEPIYFVGGVAANAAIVKALNEVISASNGREIKVIVPDKHFHIEAMGAALLAKASGRTRPSPSCPTRRRRCITSRCPDSRRPATRPTAGPARRSRTRSPAISAWMSAPPAPRPSYWTNPARRS